MAKQRRTRRIERLRTDGVHIRTEEGPGDTRRLICRKCLRIAFLTRPQWCSLPVWRKECTRSNRRYLISKGFRVAFDPKDETLRTRAERRMLEELDRRRFGTKDQS